MDYMDPSGHCPKKAIKLYHSPTSQTLEDGITNYLSPIRAASRLIAYNGVHVLNMLSYSNCVAIISILRFQWNKDPNIVETARHCSISKLSRIW